MPAEEIVKIDELTVWVERGSSVHLKIASRNAAMMELSGDQARKLAAVLLEMADDADA